MYFEPPYVLFLAGFLAAISSGLAFSATLKQSLRAWSGNRSGSAIADIKSWSLKLPFLGICIGVCVFLASGIGIFGFPAKAAYAMGIPMTLMTALLVWTQLGKNLELLERGGSKALDLDMF